MIDKRTKLYFRDLAIALLTGIAVSIVIRVVDSLYSIYFDLSGMVVKVLSVISAALLGLYFKSYKDEEKAIKELKVPDESPSNIKENFYGKRDDFYFSLSNRRHLFIYGFTLLFFIILIFSMPLPQLRAKGIDELAYVFLGSGLNISTIVFCIALAFYINRQIETSRKAKVHFSETIALEERRKELIKTLNESLRKQVDARIEKPIEKNPSIDLRTFIESLEKTNTEIKKTEEKPE